MIVAYYNGTFTEESFEESSSLVQQIFSFKNLFSMNREITFLTVVFTLYLLLNRVNEKLDREEEILKQKNKIDEDLNKEEDE